MEVDDIAPAILRAGRLPRDLAERRLEELAGKRVNLENATYPLSTLYTLARPNNERESKARRARTVSASLDYGAPSQG